MKEKSLRQLSRKELLELLIEQSVRIEELEKELAETYEALNNTEIKIRKAGSIAEASLQLNSVFEAAQKAADQYLSSIKKMYKKQKAAMKKMKKSKEE
ncbi:MAG: DNA repair protein [Clostridia bacterium]|nr:DNA repair protein [Lachnospiraceae bacterium]MBR6427387.1 DNA repair protein [Clostridia bacterium]